MPSPRRRTPSQEHLQRVQALTDAALAHLTLERLLDELLVRIRELLAVDTAAVLLLDDDRKELIATAAKGIEEEVEQGVRLPVGRGFAGTIAATAQPVILGSVDHTKVLNPLLLRKKIRSMLGVPLISQGSVIGVLHVGSLVPRVFTEEDVELLQLVADRAALALDARRHHEQAFIAETLHRSLLPDRFPRIEGAEISGLYVPADGGMVGGDWYDVFALPSGALCIVVGDSVGKGLPAAVAMSRLRDAVRTLMFVDPSPPAAMVHLNELIRHFDPELMATAFIGILRRGGPLMFSSAGHVPPVVVDADGRASLLDGIGEPALGAVHHSYLPREVPFPVGSTLIAYTDGLVERRGRSLDEGLEDLRREAEHPWLSVEELCARVVGSPNLRDVLIDDLAVIAVRFPEEPTGAHLKLSINADPRELGSVRLAVRRWGSENRVTDQDLADIMTAIGEALSNAVEHAYGPGRGDVRLMVELEGRTVRVTVQDDGRWREPRGDDRGRGSSLMSAAMDAVHIDRAPTGTTVRMHKVLADETR